ncbi:MAG: PAS domain-containing protein, partial [Verrucomicrobia bacterium]|nr:PAS domain-containing protein [Verrucomicrobiota bacterium]
MTTRRSSLTRKQLLEENAELRARLAEAEERLRARHPEGVEAAPGDGGGGERVFDPNERERTHQALASAALAVQDVTDLRRTEEATLRGILDATQESIWLFSPEGRMLMGNTIAFQRFGKPPADIIGKHFNEILPPELARTRLARLREVVEFARPVDFEDERCGIFFHHRFYPVLDAAGQVTSVACFSRDVTERKRSDGERVQLLTRLQEQHAELDAVLAAIQDVVLIYDKDGTVRLVNRACVPAYGFDPTNHSLPDIVRRNSYHDIDGRPLDAESVPTARALRGESVRNAQCVVQRMDGAEAAWEISSTPLRIGGEVVGAVTVWHDITERQKVAERLRQSEALYRAIGESIDYGVWTCAPDGRNTYASESFLKLVGLTQEQCSNFGWGAVLH